MVSNTIPLPDGDGPHSHGEACAPLDVVVTLLRLARPWSRWAGSGPVGSFPANMALTWRETHSWRRTKLSSVPCLARVALNAGSSHTIPYWFQRRFTRAREDRPVSLCPRIRDRITKAGLVPHCVHPLTRPGATVPVPAPLFPLAPATSVPGFEHLPGRLDDDPILQVHARKPGPHTPVTLHSRQHVASIGEKRWCLSLLPEVFPVASGWLAPCFQAQQFFT